MLNADVLRGWHFEDIPLSWTSEDAARYALSINIGADPLDREQIAMATGQSATLFPTMATIMGRPGHWLADPRTGVDHGRMLIGEVAIDVDHPLPVEGRGHASHRVVAVSDKGEGRGALVTLERRIIDARGDCAIRFRVTNFCRADGGFSGGSGGDEHRSAVVPFPAGPDDRQRIFVPTLPQQALLFALNGDRNPIHIDPERASRAGLQAPVLHGMATLGLLAAALFRQLGDPTGYRLKELAGRFSAPVLPGQVLLIEYLCVNGRTLFRALERDSRKVVFDAGVLQLGS